MSIPKFPKTAVQAKPLTLKLSKEVLAKLVSLKPSDPPGRSYGEASCLGWGGYSCY